ncbi:hypothetical protein ACFQGA_12475 [Marinobacter koreensis]|uniref:hypothetical protein n=1 Tax=Marinobacter koreensis TaxID=335974 RepID=UPI00361A91A4
MSLEKATIQEDSAADQPEEPRVSHCAQPDLSQIGQHTFNINIYDDEGVVTGQKTVTYPTYPIYVKLKLDQPSVTRIQVAFQLNSLYNPEACDNTYKGAPPHQRCDFSSDNLGNAIIGKDIVGLGSESPSPVDINGNPLDYLSYETDDNGNLTQGVVTLEPGVQECYVRLEVVDDSFAELSETAQLSLTSVRSGLAGLGPSNDRVDASIVIEDDEPSVSLETLKGGDRDTVNVGSVEEYRAVISGEHPDREIRVRLTQSEDSTARLGTEFEIERKAQDGSWVTSPELVFPAGENEQVFRINVLSGAPTGIPVLPDLFFNLVVDEKYQAGREDYARPGSENLLRISVNQQTTPLSLGTSSTFVPTDIAMGHNGRLFVTGYDKPDGNRIRVKIYDQTGNLLQDVGITPQGDSIPAPSDVDSYPVINTVQRQVTEGNNKVNRYEFIVAYNTSGTVNGTANKGGEDVISSVYWFDEASNGGEYVPKWTARTGTSGNDRVREAKINEESGYVVLFGETDGIWPGEQSAGGYDSFAQRIDTVVDGSNETPVVAWTQQVGASTDDSVAGGNESGVSPLVFGSASGSVGGAAVIGGIDGFFYSANGGEASPDVRQVGSDADDAVTDGLVLGGNLWLLGNSDGKYFSVKQDDVLTLGRTNLDSQAGFLVSYNTSGDFVNAFTLNDAADSSTETFGSVVEFGGDLVAGGTTDGVYSPGATDLTGIQGILSRVSLENSDSAMTDDSRQWRTQLDIGNSEITTLANYRDDEIIALARNGTDWEILLFSPEGRLLTTP